MSATKKIAINGFGRIGRMVTRILLEKYKGKFDIVGINDLTSTDALAHLFEFDSTYGRFNGTVEQKGENLVINGDEVKIFSERDPSNLPWKDLEVDVVLECTGVFRTREGMQKHIDAGAKKVLLSAPAKDEIDCTIVLGVNDNDYNAEKHHLISNASCTTNCLAPIAKVLNDEFGIEQGLMTTVHSYTGDQRLLDAPHRDMRRSRSACESIIPTTTGAAKAVALVIPELEGKLNGMAMRVPTPTVSVVDLTVQLEKSVTAIEVNAAFKKASENEMKGILGLETKPLVSKDFQGDSHSSIVDESLTMSMENGFVKVVSWYDNEWGYSSRLADLVMKI